MKKALLLSAALLAGFCVNAQSVDRPQSAQQVEDMLAKTTKQAKLLDEAVNLSTTQEEKAYAILLEKNKALQATPEKSDVINRERIAEIKAILTTEQQPLFQKALEEQNKKKAKK